MINPQYENDGNLWAMFGSHRISGQMSNKIKEKLNSKIRCRKIENMYM